MTVLFRAALCCFGIIASAAAFVPHSATFKRLQLHPFVAHTTPRFFDTSYHEPLLSSLSVRKHEHPIHAVSTVEDTQQTAEVPPVRRVYETYRWKYSSGQQEHAAEATSATEDEQHLEEEEEEEIYYHINYRVEGPVDGPPILLVHGFGANINHFRYQFPALVEAGYRVYAVDLLGFGASDKPAAAAYSMELFAQLLKDFILHVSSLQHKDKQQQQTWRIAGNSIGGLCSLMVAQNLPHLVQGVILFNCSGGMTGFRYEDVPWWVRPILYLVQTVVIRGPVGPAFFANFRTRENVESILRRQGVYRDDTNVNEELMEILLAPADDEGASDVFLNVFGGPPGPTPESILPDLACPILVMWGSADPWTPYDRGMHPGTGLSSFYFAGDNNKKKDSDFFQLEVLPGAGHCPHDEFPNLVNAKMIAWMEQMNDRYTPGDE